MPQIRFRVPSLESLRASSEGNAMIRMSEDDSFSSFLTTGCPGSGKTTLSILRLARLTNLGYDVLFITYQKLLVLAIKNVVQNPVAKPAHITTFHRWYYDLTKDYIGEEKLTSTRITNKLEGIKLPKSQETELLIDEGQDLPSAVYEVLPRYFRRCLVSADNGQRVHKDGALTEQIAEILESCFSPYRHAVLSRNFRNTYEVYRFSRQFAPRTNFAAWDENILASLKRAGRRGPKPIVVGYRNIESRNEHLRVVLDNSRGANVAVLCERGPSRNQSKEGACESVDEIHELITGMGFAATKYHNELDTPNSLEQIIVTTYISAKGMEFDTIVIPRINSSRPQLMEQWYVACTRCITGLTIYHDLTNPYYDPICKLCSPDTYDAELSDKTDNDFTDDIPF